MQYRVTGYSKDNGAKITIELEAQSKAEAERKAIRQNMQVIRVELSSEAEARDPAGEAPARRPVSGASASRGGSGIAGKLLTLLILLAIAAAAWYFWPQISAMVSQATGRR